MTPEMIENLSTTYDLSPEDAELLRATCMSVSVEDWQGFALGKKKLTESDNPNAILAFMAFNNHFLGRPAPKPVPYAAPTPEGERVATAEAAALMSRLGVKPQ